MYKKKVPKTRYCLGVANPFTGQVDACNVDITHTHHHKVRCTTCQKRHRALNLAKLKFKSTNTLGTTDFSSHKKPTVEKEIADIVEEMKRLGMHDKIRRDQADRE